MIPTSEKDIAFIRKFLPYVRWTLTPIFLSIVALIVYGLFEYPRPLELASVNYLHLSPVFLRAWFVLLAIQGTYCSFRFWKLQTGEATIFILGTAGYAPMVGSLMSFCFGANMKQILEGDRGLFLWIYIGASALQLGMFFVVLVLTSRMNLLERGP
jgi:hypothetical protein